MVRIPALPGGRRCFAGLRAIGRLEP